MKQLSLIFMMCFSLSIYAQNNSTSINMNINMNLDATSGDMPETQQNSDMNINLNIEETQQGHSNTSHNQATTTATKQPEVIYVSGYSGKIGCTPPVNSERLEDMAKTVKNQTFGDDKVRVTKQIVRSNCITLDQLIVLLNEFDWDDGTIDDHGEQVSLVVNSVAPEATLNMRNSTLYTDDINAAWVAFNDDEYHIINNSFGRARFNHNTGVENTNFDAEVTNAVSINYEITGSATYDEDILFIFAAGNSGNYCPDKRIHECTFGAAVLHQQRANGKEDKDAVMWVGSLTDDGTALAGYSHSAGEMANDFMVAHDDVLTKGDLAGTSFAAPRVTGAAALVRQKFPLLDGQELKSLLLNTATDMGAAGPDPIFGMGKLDLNNALSPQGIFTAQ